MSPRDFQDSSVPFSVHVDLAMLRAYISIPMTLCVNKESINSHDSRVIQLYVKASEQLVFSGLEWSGLLLLGLEDFFISSFFIFRISVSLVTRVV